MLHFEFLSFISNNQRDWVHTGSSILAHPCCTYHLFDTGHKSCMLKSSEEQKQKRPQVALWTSCDIQLCRLHQVPLTVTNESDLESKVKSAGQFKINDTRFQVLILTSSACWRKGPPSWTKPVLRWPFP